MKHNIYAYVAAIAAFGMTSCATSSVTRQITTDPAPCVLAPDRDGRAEMKIDINIPSDFMSRRMRLYITPQLVTGGQVAETYEPIILEGNIFRKKAERARVLRGEEDSYSSAATVINTSQPYTIELMQEVRLPRDIESASVIGVVSTEGCGRCEAYDILDLAVLSTPLTLLPPLRLQTMWDDRQKVLAPKVFNGREEAHLQFNMNKADINLSLGSNKSEMKRVQTKLTPVVKDSYSTLNSLKITGMASADGPLKLNTKLARERAQSASDWIVSAISFPPKVKKRIKVTSRPEGWEPVLKAMRADRHPDAEKVARILEKYKGQDDDVAEKHIRALKSWKEIASRYLDKDRKVEFEYSYTIKNFTTDKELRDMYARRPDLFSEAEFLKIAAMCTNNPDSLKNVYSTAVKYFPDSATSVNNLGVLYIREGDYEKARGVLADFYYPTPAMFNNMAVADAALGDIPTAIELLKPLPDDVSQYNLGLLYAHERNTEEAYRLLEPYNDINTAIVALAVNENKTAMDIMNEIKDESPLAEYVRALAAARLGMKDDFFVCLGNAVKEPRLKSRASSEPDFFRYHSDDRYKALISK